MDKRMQRAKLNAASTLLYQLVTTAVGVIIPWIMIGHFGSEAYGATTSIAQFLAYIALFEGGIGRVARGALYGPLARGEEEKVSGIYYAVKRFFATLGLAFLGYALILALFYYDIADVTVFTRRYAFFLVLSIALGKFAEYMGGISNITLFNADQRQYVVNSVLILSNVLNVLLVILLVHFGADILWVKLGGSIVFLLKPILFTLYLKKHYRIQKPKIRTKLENKATGIAQHTAFVVQNNTDVLILTLFADLKTVAVYSVYHLIAFSLRNVTTAFTGGMEAVFGNMIAKGEIETLRNTYEKYKFMLTVLTLMLFGAAGALIVPFVKLYTIDATDANYVQPVFAIVLLLAEAINCLVLPCFNLSIASNKLKECQLGAYGEAAINLVASIALVFWNPLVGVAIGTLASAIFKSLYYMIFAAKNILQVRTGKIIVKFSLVTVSLLAAIVIGMAVTEGLPLYNYWRWIAAGFGTVAITALVAIVVGLLSYPQTVKDYIRKRK